LNNGIIVVLYILVGCALPFLCCALFVKGLSWAFGFAFTWKLAFGIWLLLVIIRSLFCKEEWEG
jgi:hypothetical protein